MRSSLLIALALFIATSANSQTNPTLLYGTYFGGVYDDAAYGLARDGKGNLYITGSTQSDSGIATPGAYQTTLNVGTHAFLAKFNSAGTLVWATYFEGNNEDVSNAVAVDGQGNVYITGYTYSDSGITTAGAFDTVYASSQYTGFLAKFDSAGARQWATYFGGNGYSDASNNISVDGSGNVYITGYTYSDSGIASPGAYDTVYGGPGGDAFLAKFNGAGARLWSTYYGGTAIDAANGVITDSLNNVYITGYTYSTSGIATLGAYKDSITDQDAFVAKFDSTGTLLWGTYYGGNNNDEAVGMATDGRGYIYITGYTYSDSGLATPGAYDTTFSGNSDAFVAKFDSAGGFYWSTYYGESNNTSGNAIAADTAGHVYVTGETYSSAGIATTGAYKAIGDTVNGDVFLAQFSNTGALLYGTYYGGSDLEVAYGVVTDGLGNIYLAGGTNSTSGIATPGAHQTVFGGGGNDGEGELGDAFLAKFGISTMGIANVSNALNNITVFPNPSTGQFYFKGITGGSTLEVYDVLGQQIFSAEMSPFGGGRGRMSGDTYLLNISGNAKGVYFYRIVDSAYNVQEGKMVLE